MVSNLSMMLKAAYFGQSMVNEHGRAMLVWMTSKNIMIKGG